MLSESAYQYFIDQYQENYCYELIKFCASGRSPEAFAAEIDSTPEVFPIWANIHPEWEIALHIAFWKSFAWWENALQTNPDIDAKIFKLVMGQRFKWSEDGQDMKKLLLAMDEKQLETLARRLLSGDQRATIDAYAINTNNDTEADDDEI